MKKRYIALLALVLACFAGAMFAIIWSTEQSRQRSMVNINRICEQLERVTGEDCQLQRPPSGIADGERRTQSTDVLAAASVPPSSIDRCKYRISTRGRYHDQGSPYWDMLRRDAPCVASLAEVRAMGAIPPR